MHCKQSVSWDHASLLITIGYSTWFVRQLLPDALLGELPHNVR